MNSMEKVGHQLEIIKDIPGVENVILTQQDGFPIKSAGLWLAKDDIFKVSSSTSAIYSVAKRIHPQLQYVLLEGENAKIFIAPLIDCLEFYLAITTLPQVNLGAIFMRMNQSLKLVKEALLESGGGQPPPLRSFTREELDRIHQSFKVKPQILNDDSISQLKMGISQDLSARLNDIIYRFRTTIPGVKSSSIILKGGYLLGASEANFESNAAMTFSLFDTSRRLAWITKNTVVKQVLCKTSDVLHFVYYVKGAVFSAEINRELLRLGLLRLLIPSYIQDVTLLLTEAEKIYKPVPLEFTDPLVFKPIGG